MATFQNRLLFLFCAAYRIPTAVDIHDIREQAAAVGSGSFGVRKGMERYCITRATLLLALNPLMWEHIRQTYHTGVSPVVFISNGVEEEFFTWHPAPYSPVEGQFNICYTGALTKNRGIDFLVRSCSILHEHYPWVRLHLIGPYGPGIPDDLKEEIEIGDFIVRTELPYNPQEPYLNYYPPRSPSNISGRQKQSPARNASPS